MVPQAGLAVVFHREEMIEKHRQESIDKRCKTLLPGAMASFAPSHLAVQSGDAKSLLCCANLPVTCRNLLRWEAVSLNCVILAFHFRPPLLRWRSESRFAWGMWGRSSVG